MLNRSRHFLTHWMLMLLILMGPWLSLWTTPQLAKTEQGQQIFLCTLQGIKAVSVSDLTDSPSLVSGQHHSICPALQLFAMLGQGMAQPPQPAPPLAVTRFRSGFVDIVTPALPRLRSYPARAPPVA